MGTPAPGTRDAALYDYVGLIVRDYIRKQHSPNERILDIGAGWGKYKLLLPEYEMDAVEVWQPYIAENNLTAMYAEVSACDIGGWFPSHRYGVAIFGDSFEHLNPETARIVLDRLRPFVREFVVAIPYEMKQGESDGNPHEKHLQDDLTPSLMRERYPELECIAEQGNRAVYVG